MSDARKPLSLVVAFTRAMGIGKDGGLPWPALPTDLKRFATLTKGSPVTGTLNAVIMGRKTWQSIPAKFRPLSGRVNIVISSQPDIVPPATAAGSAQQLTHCVASFDEALSLVNPGGALAASVADVFVIGGSSLFAQAMALPECSTVHATQVLKAFPCDVTMLAPEDCGFEVDAAASAAAAAASGAGTGLITENGVTYHFLTYTRAARAASSADGAADGAGAEVSAADAAVAAIGQGAGALTTLIPTATRAAQVAVNAEEAQYLHLIADIVCTGRVRADRTGTGTVSQFGAQMRFSLRDGRFPLLTTKRTFWRGVKEELLWFIRGCTDASQLSKYVEDSLSSLAMIFYLF